MLSNWSITYRLIYQLAESNKRNLHLVHLDHPSLARNIQKHFLEFSRRHGFFFLQNIDIEFIRLSPA